MIIKDCYVLKQKNIQRQAPINFCRFKKKSSSSVIKFFKWLENLESLFPFSFQGKSSLFRRERYWDQYLWKRIRRTCLWTWTHWSSFLILSLWIKAKTRLRMHGLVKRFETLDFINRSQKYLINWFSYFRI